MWKCGILHTAEFKPIRVGHTEYYYFAPPGLIFNGVAYRQGGALRYDITGLWPDSDLI